MISLMGRSVVCSKKEMGDIPGTMFSAADMCDLFMQDHPFASGDRKDHNNSFSYDGSDNDLPF